MMIIFYYLAPIFIISWFFLDWFGFLMIFCAAWLAFYLKWCTGGIKKHYTASKKYYCMAWVEGISVRDSTNNETIYVLDRPQEGEDVNLSQFYTQQLCNANMAYQQGLTYNGEYTAIPLNADEIIEVVDVCVKIEENHE